MRVEQGRHGLVDEGSRKRRSRGPRLRREPHALLARAVRRGPSVPTAGARGLVAAGLTLVALTGALAGCGSSASTGTSADPAGVVPAYAPVYAGAVVRPEGRLKDQALAAGHALTGQKNPYTRLLGVLQTPGSTKLDFGRDLAPWLGENAGLFFTALGSSAEALTSTLLQGLTGAGAGVTWPFASGERQGAIVLDTRDLAAAQKFVSTQAAHAGAHATSYKGVSYQASAGGDAFAVIDKLVVLGTDTGVRAVIDTTRSGASLKGDGSYAQLQTVAPAGALGHLYSNPGALRTAHTAAAGARSSASKSPLGLLEELGGARPLNVSLTPDAKSLALDADTAPARTASAGATGATGATGSAGLGGSAGDGGLVGGLATGNRAFAELPGEAWLAAGIGDAGGGSGRSLQGLRNLLSLASTLSAAGGEGGPPASSSAQVTLSIKGLLEGLLTPLNALAADTPQARRDFRAWMGEAGVFASGTTVLELKAAVAIDSSDPAASRAAVGKLASALNGSGAEATPTSIPGTEAAVEAKITGLPVTLVIADGRAANGKTKFVLGLGESSITGVLNPPSTMSGAAAYTAAQSALGEGIQPSLTTDFPTLLSLLEGVGLSEDSTIAPFVPYLRNATTLAGGGKSLGGGMERLRFVLGLRQPGSG